MNAKQSVAFFAQKYSLDTEKLFANGKLIVNVDGDLDIECIYANSYIYISGSIMQLPVDKISRVNILRKALKANFALLATERCSLNIDNSSTLLITTATNIKNMDKYSFENMITTVVNNILLFKNYLTLSAPMPFASNMIIP